jgi:hypothetical protein
MAERLRSFDFTAQSAITSAESKGRNRYPWDDWFNGDIWKITRGEDFDAEPLMMERIIRTRASNKNHRAKVTLRHLPAVNGDAPSIVLQRTDMLSPAAMKKAEQAEKRKARKAQAEVEAQQTLAAAGIAPKTNGTPAKATGAVKSVSKRPAKKAPTPRKRATASV